MGSPRDWRRADALEGTLHRRLDVAADLEPVAPLVEIPGMLAGIIAAIGFALPTWPTFAALGAVQFLGSALFVGIRAAGSITSEREKQTWDSLLVTRMDAHQLLRGKLWGHIDAVRPYLLAYLIPIMIAAWWSADWWCIFGTLYVWLAGWIFLYYLGAVGITASVSATSTWRSILTTLVRTLTSLVISQLILTYVVIFLWATLIVFLLPNSWRPTAMVFSVIFAPIPAMLWLLAVAEERLEQAERTLIESDRALARG